MITADVLFGELGGKRSSSKSYMLHCPAHDDKTPSLSAKDTGSRLVLNCFAGCSYKDVIAALSHRGIDLPKKRNERPRKSLRNAMSKKRRNKNNKFGIILKESRIAFRHPYCVLKGIHPPSIRVRDNQLLIPMNDKKGNLVGIQRIDENGVKRFMKGSILKGSFFEIGQVADTIYIAEGFATTQSIFESTGDLSVVAFSSNNLARVAEIFTAKYPDAVIVIAGDADQAGIKSANEAAQSAKCKVAFPYDEPVSGALNDFNDLYLEKGKKAVIRRLKRAKYIEGAEKKLRVVPVGIFVEMKLPRRSFLLEPIIERQGLVMLHAYRGVGKTYLALEIAVAVASGRKFLNWTPSYRPQEVIYVDGEMPANLLQERLRKMTGRLPSPHLPLRIFTPDLYGSMPNIATENGRKEIERYFTERTKLLVLDNLSTLARSGVENDAESWQPIQDWLLKLRRRGMAVLIVHHSGKKEQQRGTSKREDVLNLTIHLEHPDGYSPEEGARFIITFEKNRTIYGSKAAPFEIRLSENADGNYVWEIGSAIPEKYRQVLELTEAGKTQKEIAKELGVKQSTVSRRLKEAKKYTQSSGDKKGKSQISLE